MKNSIVKYKNSPETKQILKDMHIPYAENGDHIEFVSPYDPKAYYIGKSTSIVEATDYANKAHTNQERKESFLPYIVHPMDVVTKLISWGITDEISLCAALLHDVVEDTAVEIEDIYARFHPHIANIVREMTRFDNISKKEYLNSFSQASLFACIVKAADRICNLNDFNRSGSGYIAKYKKDSQELINILLYRLSGYPVICEELKTWIV